MHYRWNFDQDNLDFLLFHFQTIFQGEDAEQLALVRRRDADSTHGLQGLVQVACRALVRRIESERVAVLQVGILC